MTYVIGQGTEVDPHALKLETRAQHMIKNEIRLEVNPKQMKQRVQLIKANYQGVRPVSASAVYNCYGMVFAARRCWILGEDDVDLILRDDGYRKLPWDPASWLVGDLVLYTNAEGELQHVGMIALKEPNVADGSFKIEVLSTWGESGEYLHPMKTVSPLLGTPTSVYAQRFLFDEC